MSAINSNLDTVVQNKNSNHSFDYDNQLNELTASNEKQYHLILS